MPEFTQVIGGAKTHLYRENDIYIGRPSIYGNPFRIGWDGTREEVVQLYREWIKGRPDLLDTLRHLKGCRLVCYCKPQPCHGDVLAELIDDA